MYSRQDPPPHVHQILVAVGTARTDVVRQGGPGLALAEPPPTLLCRTTSLGGEGKEHSMPFDKPHST